MGANVSNQSTIVKEDLNAEITSTIETTLNNQVKATASNVQSIRNSKLHNCDITFAEQFAKAEALSNLTSNQAFTQDVTNKAVSILKNQVDQKASGQPILSANITNSNTNVDKTIKVATTFTQRFTTTCSRESIGTNTQELVDVDCLGSTVNFARQDVDVKAMGDCASTNTSNIKAANSLESVSDLKTTQSSQGLGGFDIFGIVVAIALAILLWRLVKTNTPMQPRMGEASSIFMYTLIAASVLAAIWALVAHITNTVPAFDPILFERQLNACRMKLNEDGKQSGEMVASATQMGADVFPSINVTECAAHDITYKMLVSSKQPFACDAPGLASTNPCFDCGVADTSIQCGLYVCKDAKYITDLTKYRKVSSACMALSGFAKEFEDALGSEIETMISTMISANNVLRTCTPCGSANPKFPSAQVSKVGLKSDGTYDEEATRQKCAALTSDMMLSYSDPNTPDNQGDPRNISTAQLIASGDCMESIYQTNKRRASLTARAAMFVRNQYGKSRYEPSMCDLETNLAVFFPSCKDNGKQMVCSGYGDTPECRNDYKGCQDGTYKKQETAVAAVQSGCEEAFKAKQSQNVWQPAVFGGLIGLVLVVGAFVAVQASNKTTKTT